MKLVLIAYLYPLLFLPAGGSFYSLSCTRLDGSMIALSSLQGKKVLLFAFNGSNPNWGMLRAIDSIQKLHADSMSVIAFPALDFDSAVNTIYLGKMHDSLGLHLTFAQPGFVKRKAGQRQLVLFQWLTSMTGNGHFNRDVEKEGQIFVVDGKGTLYSIIEEQTYRWALPKILSRKGAGE
jgi:glutathione peroxidase-family protein